MIFQHTLELSQLALPEDVCTTVFETAEGYSQSLSNMAQVSLESDNVFSDDGAVTQLRYRDGQCSGGIYHHPDLRARDLEVDDRTQKRRPRASFLVKEVSLP